MSIHNDDTRLITEVLTKYFRDYYPDDINDSLFGVIYEWKQNSLFERYFATTSAVDKIYDEEILVINRINNVAMAKVRVVFSSLVYFDYIKLFKLNDKWIVKKKNLTSSLG